LPFKGVFMTLTLTPFNYLGRDFSLPKATISSAVATMAVTVLGTGSLALGLTSGAVATVATVVANLAYETLDWGFRSLDSDIRVNSWLASNSQLHTALMAVAKAIVITAAVNALAPMAGLSISMDVVKSASATAAIFALNFAIDCVNHYLGAVEEDSGAARYAPRAGSTTYRQPAYDSAGQGGFGGTSRV
jgi:hypothetical protein